MTEISLTVVQSINEMKILNNNRLFHNSLFIRHLQVQGMSFIAAVLLLNMEVADAFICFANLLNRPCQVAFFRIDETMVRGKFYIHVINEWT